MMFGLEQRQLFFLGIKIFGIAVIISGSIKAKDVTNYTIVAGIPTKIF